MKIDSEMLKDVCRSMISGDALSKEALELSTQLANLPDLQVAIMSMILLLERGVPSYSILMSVYLAGVETGVKLRDRELEVAELEKLGGIV